MARKSQTLERIISAADQGYGDGLVLQSHKNPRRFCGDTLAKFVAIELKETFDPDLSPEEQVAEAVRVMTVARKDIQHVIDALETLARFIPRTTN